MTMNCAPTRTCLKPSYDLRTQLLLSFGSSALLSLSVVVITACFAVWYAGNAVKSSSEFLVRQQVTNNLLSSTYVLAGEMTAYMDSIESSVQLIAEGIQDRIVGYPEKGWEEDYYVPFVDTISPESTEGGERRRYPLNIAPPPMDWNIELNLNRSNAVQNLQERSQYISERQLSTASASYFIQGACNESETNPYAGTYYPNCTAENNNFATGGTVQPTQTNQGLHAKSGDLTLFLKAIFEAHPEALWTAISFHNSGAGALLQYPGTVVESTSSATQQYTSNGCEWMRGINPFTSLPFGTEEEIARCHKPGTLVDIRETNPMEHEFCQQFALNAGAVSWYGPFWNRKTFYEPPLLRVGKAVFDRKTGAFIACVHIDISIATLTDQLKNSLLRPDAEMALARYQDGSLVTDTRGSIFEQARVDLNVLDTGIVSAETLETLRNRMSGFEYLDLTESTREQARAQLAPFALETDDGFVTSFPLPLRTESSLEGVYHPIFLAIHRVHASVYNAHIDVVSSIDSDVLNSIILTISICFIGMLVITATTWCVSRMLTQPLKWIEVTAFRIVNHSLNKESNNEDNAELVSKSSLHFRKNDVPENEALPITSTLMKFTPHTEINDLVAAFNIMIRGFSRKGAAKVAEPDLYEVRNKLTWHSSFHELYSCEKRKSFCAQAFSNPVLLNSSVYDGSLSQSGSIVCTGAADYDEECQYSGKEEVSGSAPLGRSVEVDFVNDTVLMSVIPPPKKQNKGSLIRNLPSKATMLSETLRARDKWHHSRLFWCIMFLIVIPMLLTTTVTCIVVSRDITSVIPSWVEETAGLSYELEMSYLAITAQAKASLLKASVFESIRDLHLLTRFAGWVFFNAVENSDSFTELASYTERCKAYNYGTCPYHPCQNTSTSHRDERKNFYSLQKSDYDPITGDRRTSSFPYIDFSPTSTEWWSTDLSQMPGVGKAENATGFRTAYDRVRIASIMAVVQQPVYSYAVSLRRDKWVQFSALAFENDGLFTGFSGCTNREEDLAAWKSNDENGAYTIAPDLCPKGKYGYDPRCQKWYVDGKEKYLHRGAPVHVTQPSSFFMQPFDSMRIGATSPIANPRTNEYIGQVLLEFEKEELMKALIELNGARAVLITPEGHVIADDHMNMQHSFGEFLFLPTDHENRLNFENDVLPSMIDGSSGFGEFRRLQEDGKEDTLLISFSPVFERTLLPSSPDDFAAGVSISNSLIYSVGIIKSIEEMRMPFHDVAGEMQRKLTTIRSLYVGVTVAVSLVFTLFACIITISITKPVASLLRIVNQINEEMVEENLMPMNGGSREVQGVYNTFSKLFHVVRLSNTAFFSHNLKWALHFVTAALALFREIRDGKAVGIACNNIANTLFAMIQTSTLGEHGIEGDDFVSKALAYYDESVEIARHDFGTLSLEVSNRVEGAQNATYALQLSDRLFNRGLFCLNMHLDGRSSEKNLREQGYRDIAMARALDHDTKEYWLEQKLLLKNSDQYFCRLIRRINGLSNLIDDVGILGIWDVNELLQEADKVLFAAWDHNAAPLFRDVSRTGRLQQIEGSAIRLLLNKGDDMDAARLAMRMFAEDEFILEGPFSCAAEALLRWTRRNEDNILLSKESSSCICADLRKMAKQCKHVSLRSGKCFVFTVELSRLWEGNQILKEVNVRCLKLYDQYFEHDDYFSVICQGSSTSLAGGLEIKEGNEGRQRSTLDAATQAISPRQGPAFPTAFQMIVDSSAVRDRDSFMLVLMDDAAWDIDSCLSIQTQLGRLSDGSHTTFHLFILGFNVQDERIRRQCQSLCKFSKSSFYADVTCETIDSIFDSIASAIVGLQMYLPAGITMGKF